MTRGAATQLAGVVVIAAACVAAFAVGGDAIARALRRSFELLTPLVVIEIAAALLVIGIAGILARPILTRAGPTRVTWPSPTWMTPTVGLSAIVGAAAVMRASLAAANHSPKVLGDELVYVNLARGWAWNAEPLLRGSHEIGYSILYPVLLAPVYRLSHDGATALEAIRTLNAFVMATTAVPSYFLARRVVPARWALGVAALSVFNPWTGYASLTMTESLFYPLFVTYAAVLVSVLERPTRTRQALLLGLLAAVVLARAQAIAVAVGTVAAIGVYGTLERRFRSALRAFAPTLVVVGGCFVLGIVAATLGISHPTGSYDAVFGSLQHALGIVKWGVFNTAAFELELGVVALVALPVAVAGLLGRSATPPERATGVVASLLSLSVLGSVALLSASPYGLGVLHTRNLFYVAPLVLTCLAHWLHHGLRRPPRLSVVCVVAGIAVVVALPSHLVLVHANSVDLPSASFFGALHERLPGIPFRVWTVVLGVVGAGTFLLARKPLLPLLTVALAFAAVTARYDNHDSLTREQARALAWVDHAAPKRERVTLVYVDLPSGAACASPAGAEQQDLTTWTEFFNTRIDRVDHIYAANPRDYLTSHELTFGNGGLVLDDGKPFEPRLLVIDSRQPLVGTRLARFDLGSLGNPDHQAGASLTLWKVDPPLRFYSRADPLPPRGDGRSC